MRIEKVILKNYRQFRDAEVSFERGVANDLHLVIGANGTGKTNILNAINWCLYGDEPHLSKHSQRLPLLNLRSIQEADSAQDQEVVSEIWARSDDGSALVFSRKAGFRVYDGDKEPVQQYMEFGVRVTDDKGNTQILVGDEADYCTERFVPSAIREFFFFDGERLDSYFKEATGQHIRHAVFEMSQIGLLDTVESKLDTTLKDLRRQAGRANPRIEEASSKLDKAEGDLALVEKQIRECHNQISRAGERVAEYEEKLRGLPDTAALEEERKDLIAEDKRKEALRGEKEKEKEDLLFDYAVVMRLWSAIQKSIQTIDEKRASKEIPPTVDDGLLRDVLDHKFCSICGRALDSESEVCVTNLLKDIKLTSDIAQELLAMENPLRSYRDELKRFEGEIGKVTRELDEYDRDLATIERRKGEIDRELDGYDVEQIRQWHRERAEFERIRDNTQRHLGGFQTHEKSLLDQIGVLKKQLDQELKKEAKATELRRHIDFCERALDVVRRTKQTIMTQARKEIESETKRLFFALAWKSETFGGIEIDENYNIHLIHSMGYDCLGSASAAERELLALSFTLALHKISGFDSPILIDTPVARVSDRHRVNFGDVFLQVSSEKQTVLLFTPAEHSEDIAQLLDRKSSNRFVIKLSSDEKEARLEVL